MAVNIPIVSASGAKFTISVPDPVVTGVTPTLEAFDVTTTRANLRWTPTDAVVTEVGRNGVDSVGNGPWTGLPSQLPFGNLIPDTVYTLHAIVNEVRLEAQIHTLPAGDTTAPTAPGDLAATPTTTTVTLTWAASTDNVGVTGYVVTRGGVQVATVTGLSYTDSGLSQATTYVYTVAAVDAAGNRSVAASRSVTTTGGAPQPGVGFPRLGGYYISSPHNYDNTGYQAQLARLDVAILGMYNRWAGGGKTPGQVVNEIHARNPGIKLALYTIMTEVPQNPGASWADVDSKLRAQDGPNGVGDWYAYNSSGSRVSPYPSTYATNLTLLTTPDSAGRRFPQWMAERDNTEMFSKANWDMWYCDVTTAASNAGSTAVDWDRSGSNDDSATGSARYRLGQRAYFDRVKQLQPNKLLMLNPAGNDLGSVEYRNVGHSAIIEAAMGLSWSIELQQGFAGLMTRYRAVLANLLAPKMVLVNQHLGGSPMSSASLQSMRYGFAATLMDDGYYAATDTSYTTVLWFDEYQGGTSSTKWLGAAVDPPQTTAWSNGVYRRRFQNGMVLVNPKGNGSRTVTPGSGFRRISGSQAPSVNNGQPVTSTVTLADRDGLILARI